MSDFNLMYCQHPSVFIMFEIELKGVFSDNLKNTTFLSKFFIIQNNKYLYLFEVSHIKYSKYTLNITSNSLLRSYNHMI